MLKLVSMRITVKDNDKEGREITDYTDCLIQTENVTSVLPSGIDGVLQVKMLNQDTHLIRAEVSALAENQE